MGKVLKGSPVLGTVQLLSLIGVTTEAKQISGKNP